MHYIDEKVLSLLYKLTPAQAEDAFKKEQREEWAIVLAFTSHFLEQRGVSADQAADLAYKYVVEGQEDLKLPDGATLALDTEKEYSDAVNDIIDTFRGRIYQESWEADEPEVKEPLDVYLDEVQSALKFQGLLVKSWVAEWRKNGALPPVEEANSTEDTQVTQQIITPEEVKKDSVAPEASVSHSTPPMRSNPAEGVMVNLLQRD